MYNQYLQFQRLIILLLLSCATIVIKPAQPMQFIPQVIDMQRISSQDFINKFDQLRQLVQQNPSTINFQAYLQLFDPSVLGYPIKNMINEANKTGLVTQYIQIFTNTNQNIIKGFFQRYLDPSVLTAIAHLQNVYGNGQPFNYQSRNYFGNKDPYDPTIGQYTNAKNQTIIVTSYSFLRGIFDAVDQLKAEIQHYPQRYPVEQQNRFIENLRTLANNLDTAITQQAQPSFSFNLDSMIDQLRTLVRQGNNQILQELNNLLNKYRR